MATPGQSTPSTNTRDLPDPLAEKRELRRMVQELEAENERLRRKCTRQRRLLDKVASLVGGAYRPEMSWEEACAKACRDIENYWMSEDDACERGDQS